MGNNIQKIVRLIVIFSVNTACNSSSSTGVLLEDVDFSNGNMHFISNIKSWVSLWFRIKQSSEPTLNIDKGEVWLESYKDNVHTYKTVYEQEYTLTWLETENKM